MCRYMVLSKLAVRNEAEEAEVEAIKVQTSNRKKAKTEEEEHDAPLRKLDPHIKQYSGSLKIHDYKGEERKGVWGSVIWDHQLHYPKPRHIIISVRKVYVKALVELKQNFKIAKLKGIFTQLDLNDQLYLVLVMAG